jgi:TolB protein
MDCGRKCLGLAILAAGFGIAAALATLSGAASPVAGENEWIAYSSYDSGNWEIWAMRPGGSARGRLTKTLEDEKAPALSPDGRLVAFSNNRGEIGVCNLDGSQRRPLPLGPGEHSHPCWTPDGGKLIFSTRLSPLVEEADLYFIEVKNEKPGAPVPLLNMPGFEMFPDCSPDGRQVVFSHFEIREQDKRLPRPAVVEELFVLDVPSGKARQLTRLGRNCNDPCFAPDGRTVVFSSNAEGSYDLWAIDSRAPNAAPTRLTSDPGFEGAPCFSPDGSRIAFVSSRTGNLEIWSAARDGSDWRQLTRSEPGRDSTEPSWRRLK